MGAPQPGGDVGGVAEAGHGEPFGFGRIGPLGDGLRRRAAQVVLGLHHGPPPGGAGAGQPVEEPVEVRASIGASLMPVLAGPV
nr:hypothetical protein [Micromonospora kangleipakensis]